MNDPDTHGGKRILITGASGPCHYSSLAGGTKYDWALELADLAGLSMDQITPDRQGSTTPAARPGNTQLAVDKIRHTGLTRFTSFREAVQSILSRFSGTRTPQ